MSHGARSGENGWFGKTVTFSNFSERKSKETHIPHVPTYLENAVNNEWQSDRKPASSENKIILANVRKGARLLHKKIKSPFPVIISYLHIMSFITTKFHEILFSVFSGVALTNCFE